MAAGFHPCHDPARKFTVPNVVEQKLAVCGKTLNPPAGLFGKQSLFRTCPPQFRRIDAVESDQNFHIRAKPDTRPDPDRIAVNHSQKQRLLWPGQDFTGKPDRPRPEGEQSGDGEPIPISLLPCHLASDPNNNHGPAY